MQDHDIIALYFARNESAIDETRKKYGKYCMRVAMNIVKDLGDAEECVSDTYLAAWNTIPPERPQSFLAYLGRITRNLALSRYRSLRAVKRGEDETALAIDELAELASGEDVEGAVDRRALSAEISNFLREQPKNKRMIFVLRYWYAKSVREIALEMGQSEAAITMTLSRMRQKLGERLSERGFSI